MCIRDSFCHEQRSIEEFDKINDALFEDSYRAHAYALSLIHIYSTELK